MLAFKIFLNGEQITVAGGADLSVLTQMITAVGKLGPESRGPESKRHDLRLELSASGIAARQDEPSMSVSWICKELNVGDRIAIKIVETEVADKFTEPVAADLEFVKKLLADQERIRFESSKNFYLENKDKYENQS